MTDVVPEMDFLGIDLDAERETRAAEREVKADTFPIRFGGEVVAHIPTELPLDVLAPLRTLDASITILLRSIVTAMRQTEAAQQRMDAAELIVDVLAATPSLPTDIVEVVTEMGRRLMGTEGLDAFLSKRPSVRDVVTLVTRLAPFYGLTLGESRPSSPSSTEEDGSDGETSKPTSLGTTPASTPEDSGLVPVAPVSPSSESDGS